MTWLTPSVIATLSGATVLTLTYFYLYLQDKKPFMKTWTFAWAVHTLRYVFMLIIVSGEQSAYFLMLNQTTALINGILLLIGACQFINKKIPSYLILIFVCGTAWIFTSVFLNFSFFLTAVPTFFLLAVINIWIGVLFLKSSSSQKIERRIVGVTFILWGLHKANYPFLRPVEWFAPWGYLLGAAFGMVAALGLLMIYFKKTTDNLKNSEQQLKGIYDTADNIAFISTILENKNTKIIDINPGAEDVFNCTREDVIGQNSLDFHPEENKTRFFDMHQKLLSDKKTYSNQTLMVRKNKDTFPALYTVHPRLDAYDQIVGTLEVIIDLSHKQLIADEMHLQSQIISRMSEGVYLVRRGGIIVYANPKFEEMFGYAPGELIGQHASILQKNSHDTMKRIINYFETHNNWQGEIENKKKDGTIFWTFSSVTGFNHSKHGEVYIAVHLDISEQKQAQKEKQELESQLRHSHKMEAVGTLSGGIAHEFNNILGIILGNAELAMDDIPDENPTHDFLEEIKIATLRGKNIVQQLLSFSRKDSPKKQLLGINETIIETIHFLEASIPSTIELKKFIAPDCYPVMGNKAQIHQVLINLCNNAVQSMEEAGGTLSLTVQNKTLENELISKDSAISPGNYVCLVISDTGHGIPEDIIDHIFDPFYTTKSVDKGSGMGLAVVHGIMKAHNGIIRISSAINQGTTCECYFPAVLALPDMEPDQKEDLQYGTETILFVDDETALVQTGQRMLERLGYKVFAHTNPQTALNFFQVSYQKIDLVITDMTMPQMRGDQLIKKLLAINPEIKTIICTGYSSKIDEKTAQKIGSGGFIMKPMKLTTLSRTVRNILDS